MKVTIDITEDEFRHMERWLSISISMIKCGFDSANIDDLILAKVYDAAKIAKREEE